MYCPYCGTKLEDNSVFCTDCGKKVNEPQVQQTQTTTAAGGNESPKVTPAVTTQTAPVKSIPAPTPKAVPPVIPKPAPAPKPVKVKKEHKPIKINKKVIVTIILAIVLTLVYAAMAVIPFLLLDRADTVVVSTVFDDDVFGYFTLEGFAKLLTDGNKLFNPTAISLALGISLHVLTYCVPIFAAISLIASYVNKKSVSLHVLSSIMTTLYAALIAVIAPVSVWLIPNFKDALAVSLKFIMGDVAAVSSTAFIIVAGIMVGLVVIASILVGILKARRAK